MPQNSSDKCTKKWRTKYNMKIHLRFTTHSLITANIDMTKKKKKKKKKHTNAIFQKNKLKEINVPYII